MESINPTWHIDAAKFVKHQIDEDISRMTEEQRIEFFEAVKEHIHERSPLQSQPVNRIRWVDVDDVQANDYNPNSVASQEMHLLYTSILHDGYTQPVVTIYDEAIGKYVIIDGFHRYFTCKNNPDIRERNKGKLPVVVLEKISMTAWHQLSGTTVQEVNTLLAACLTWFSQCWIMAGMMLTYVTT